MLRLIVLAFALHVSGAAHLLADVLLEDDMTCADELAHGRHDGSTAPRCPASQGVGHGQGVAPSAAAAIAIAPALGGMVGRARDIEAAPPSAPSSSIERPPRA